MPELSSSEADAEKFSFWSLARHSLSGRHHDYTSVKLDRAVLLLAVPMVLEMLMESLFALADVFWVSRLGSDAIAAIGVAESVMMIIYALGIGISIAATAFVSRRVGEKNYEGAAHAAGQILLIGLAFSIGLGLVLGWFAPQILRLMGASESIIALGTPYARIMFGGNLTVILTFLIGAVFRGAGDAVICMRSLGLANLINILLGPCFIFGWLFFPKMGVTGAAVATNIGRGIGVIYLFWHLIGNHSRIRMEMRHLIPDRILILSMLRMSGSGLAQMLIANTSWIFVMKIVSLSGSAALAGYTIAMRLILFALLPAWGMANAGATLVGQNLGAAQPARSEAAVWLAARYNVWFLGTFGLVFLLFHGLIVRFFTNETAVVAYASSALWIIGLALPIYAVGMCMFTAFNGAGHAWTTTVLNLGCFWLFEIPLAYVLSQHFGLGANGAFIAIALAFVASASIGTFLFRQGHWKVKNF